MLMMKGFRNSFRTLNFPAAFSDAARFYFLQNSQLKQKQSIQA
jgi:hypothetical protein